MRRNNRLSWATLSVFLSLSCGVGGYSFASAGVHSNDQGIAKAFLNSASDLSNSAKLGVSGADSATDQLSNLAKPVENTSTESLENSDWMAKVQQDIAQREYHVSKTDKGLQAPNRQQNYRTYFSSNGIEVQDRSSDNSDPLVSLHYAGLQREGYGIQKPATSSEPVHQGNRVEIQHGDDITEWYVNTAEGLEQGFTLDKRPEGDGEITLSLDVNNATVKLNDGNIQLKTAAGRMLNYGKLKVFDASLQVLPSQFSLSDLGHIEITFDDDEATYPIVVDPLLTTTADWQVDESDQFNSVFGSSVASAGDVNGDGYSDVIVGAYQFDNGQTDEGAAFLYLGSSTGLATTAVWQAESNQPSAYFGKSVASAGDVNGDGYSDVIVGAYYFDNGQTDEGAAFLYLGSSAGLTTTASLQIESNQVSANFGASVASAGDINGDGYGDVIVGAPYYDNSEVDEGAVFVYLGSSTGLTATVSWQAESNQESALFGESVASAGDVNGDGYSDVIVGAYQFDNGQTDEGAAFLYLGSSTGLATTAVWQAESNQAIARYGYSVSSAGDVNGDGYSDVIVGAYKYTNGQSYEGAAFLYLGSSTGLATTASWQAESNQGSAGYGFNVSSAGDVNGDGYSDVIVGAHNYSNGETGEGGVFIYLGTSSGLTSKAAWFLEVNQDYAQFGRNVGGAGDVNGDGYSDVIIGADSYDNTVEKEGATFVYYGSSSILLTDIPSWQHEPNDAYAYYGQGVAPLGDINGDGFDDVIVGSDGFGYGGAAFIYPGTSGGLASTPIWQVESELPSSGYGYSVASAGDINGDGYLDVIVGEPSYNDGHLYEGRVLVYLNSPQGLSSIPDWSIESNSEYAYLGHSVATAGDVNGDGYDDVIVGAFRYANGEVNEGAAFVYLGSQNGLSTSPAWQVETNQAEARVNSVSTAGDVNGDGYDDVIVGSYLYDNVELNEGAVFVYMGSQTGLANTPIITLEMDSGGAFFGNSVSSAGDVNKDGYDDVVIGAPSFNGGEGAAYLFFGSINGLSLVNYQKLVHALEPVNGARFGASVSSAGDINGDGYSDVIIGASHYSNGETLEGETLLYLGTPNGLTVLPSWKVESNIESLYFGSKVASAGDVNGDGFSDIAVGTINYTNGETREGIVYIYHNLVFETLSPVEVSQPTGDTSEEGQSSQFSIVLRSSPTSDVTINLTSSNVSEGIVSPSSVIFSPDDWFTPKLVSVLGVDDDIDDGDVNFVIQLNTESSDLHFNELWLPDISLTNLDDDLGSISVSGISGDTTEEGGTASFTIKLDSQPQSEVFINLSSTDTSEGTVLPTSIIFTSANWNNPQVITVTGVDDTLLDGTVTYSIVVAEANSADADYNGLNPDDVVVQNLDNEADLAAPTLSISHDSGLYAPISVTLSCSDTQTGCNKIYYTLDGSSPTTSSAVYSAPLFLGSSVTLNAIATDVAGNESEVLSRNFSIDASPPNILINYPLNDSVQSSVSNVQGSTSDDASGVANITMEVSDGENYLWEISPGVYTFLSGKATVSPTDLSGGNWSNWVLPYSSWPFDKTYSVTVTATDNLGNTSTTSSIFSVALNPDPAFTTLSMNLSSQTILQNDLLDITGKLTRLPENNLSLADREIVLTVTDPEGISTQHTTNTYDALGYYKFDDLDAFPKKGLYTLKVDFAETALLSTSTASSSLLVGSSAGYAIVVQGKHPSEEGLLSHNKTTNRVYDTLIDRGFIDENIYYLNFNTNQTGVDGLPTKAALSSALDGSSATFDLIDKINGSPAPLYLIFVDHGNADTFYLGNEIISPTEIDGWLDSLEASLSPGALQEPRTLIYGACYSGSFIPEVSKAGRVVITSSAADEVSYKGPNEPDGIRSGEYFIEALFDQLGKGYSVKKSFQKATKFTEVYTRRGGDANTINAYFDDAVQHPLLDDNGDGEGTNHVIDSNTGDGSQSAELFLGTGKTYDTNSILNPAEVVEVAPVQILASNESSATLWLKPNDASIDSAWVEIRSPADELVPTSSTEQLSNDLPRELMTYNSTLERWEVDYNGFTTAGRYELYYFVKDFETGEISPMMVSALYKQKDGNALPSQVILNSPENTSEQQTTLIFDWSDSTDSNGDSIRYQLEVATDSSLANIVHIESELTNSQVAVDDTAALEDLTIYYWRVKAIDAFGGVSTSLTFSFTTNNTNGVPGILQGIIYSDADYSRLNTAKVLEGSGLFVFTDSAGEYLMLLSEGLVNITTTLTDYASSVLSNISITAGQITELNIGLTPQAQDADSDGEPDESDNCPSVSNVAQTDTDGDGVGDACDTDDDNDGLSDDAENNTYSTSPIKVDTDNDTLSDKYEVDNGLNPLVDDRTSDLDGDGYTNIEEYEAGTNPNDADDMPRRSKAWKVILPLILNQ